VIGTSTSPWSDFTSPIWLLAEAVWFGLSIGLMLAAFKSKNEWVRAGLASLGLSIIGFRLLAVIPSWWLYYSEGQMKWGGQGCIQLNLGELFASGSASNQCLKQAIKDIVVVGENAVVLGGFCVAFLIYQKKFPKQLASGESKPEATGGYK
jgi:hypothetical protein